MQFLHSSCAYLLLAARGSDSYHWGSKSIRSSSDERRFSVLLLLLSAPQTLSLPVQFLPGQ